MLLLNCVHVCVSCKHSDETIRSKRGIQEISDVIESDATNTTLLNVFTTLSAVPADENEYVCRAESALGSDKEAVEVTVQGTVWI